MSSSSTREASTTSGSWQSIMPDPPTPTETEVGERSPSPYYYLPALDSPVPGFTPPWSPALSSIPSPDPSDQGGAGVDFESQTWRSNSRVSDISDSDTDSLRGAPLMGEPAWVTGSGSSGSEASNLANYGLSHGQAWYLWERARPALSTPFGGAFDAEDFNRAFDKICLDRGKQITGPEVSRAFFATAALWKQAEEEFLRGFEALLRELTGNQPGEGPSESPYDNWAAGDGEAAFHSQLALVEKAKGALQARNRR